MKRRDVGLWAARLDQDNPREVAFASEWQRAQASAGRGGPVTGGSILGALLYGHGHGSERLCDDECATLRGHTLDSEWPDRDRTAAATLIQWLGSNVGFAFLEMALKRCGYEIVRTKR